MNKKITIGFSPCPNDTFIFDAMVHQKINTEGMEFDVVLADVETLNQWAIEKKLMVSKISYAVLPLILKDYKLLNSGSALGSGAGPLLIKKNDDLAPDIVNKLIAIPGEHTTAHLLFSLAYPEAKQKIFLPYDSIENFVLAGKGYGVIIHENRFTYQEKGLLKIADLGDYWEAHTHQPIPLGGVVVDKNMDVNLQRRIEELIRQSIEYAYESYPQLDEFITSNAQEMSIDVMKQHINLYVNNFSLDLGAAGKSAVLALLQVYSDINGSSIAEDDIFL